MKKLCLFALALVLGGCGQQESRPARSGGGSQPSQRAQPAPVAQDARPEIACFGDSLTAGLGLDPGQSYPDVLQRELDRAGYRYHVVNFGVSGDTTQDGLARVPLVLADKPSIVILEFGANDGLRGQPVSAIEANLNQLIEQLQNPARRIVLAGITLPPNYGPAYITKFTAIYPQVAAKYHLPLIPFLLVGVGGNDSLMQRDGLHPNAAGARIVAATVLKTLGPLLRKPDR